MIIEGCQWFQNVSDVTTYLVHCVVIALAQSLRKWFMPPLDLREKSRCENKLQKLEDAFVEQLCRI